MGVIEIEGGRRRWFSRVWFDSLKLDLMPMQSDWACRDLRVMCITRGRQFSLVKMRQGKVTVIDVMAQPIIHAFCLLIHLTHLLRRDLVWLQYSLCPILCLPVPHSTVSHMSLVHYHLVSLFSFMCICSSL